MNIGIVTYAGCTRCVKQCRALAKAGHRLFIFTATPPDLPASIPPESVFYTGSMYTDERSLYEKLVELDYLDIVHVHNEPSWMVNVAKKAGHKVVLDAHDLNIVRHGWEKAKEMGGEDIKALGESDGLIVPCDRYIEIIEEEVKLVIPTLTVYSYPNVEDFVTPQVEDHLGGIAYEGSIYEPVPNHPLPYRLYHEVARELLDMGFDFHIYPGRGYERHMRYYNRMGCSTHESLDFIELMKELSRHDWGFSGSPIPHRQWDNTMSNKLFDYIAAGLPPIIYQAEQSKLWAQKTGIGLVIDKLSELKELQNDPKTYQDQLIKLLNGRGQSLTMESQVPAIEEFYYKIKGRK